MKKFFHGDILRRDIFTELAPNADDIWFWAMAVLNGTKVRIPAAAPKKIYVDLDITDNVTLYSINKTQNDVQLRKVIERYPALLDKLIREAVDSKPYLTVIAPIKNPANLQACVDNIFRQNFPDCELIVINLGARINLPPLPINFRVINYPGGSLTDALNLGLRKAAGDYILFKGENSILPNDALDVAAQIAYTSKADVIHFAGHVRVVDNGGSLVRDDAPELHRDRPIYLDNATQRRAVFWLQNKLSKQLDTKIFRRDFLTDNKLTFGGDMAEFMFQALTRAEKYLLVPQAFGFFKE